MINDIALAQSTAMIRNTTKELRRFANRVRAHQLELELENDILRQRLKNRARDGKLVDCEIGGNIDECI